MATTRSWILADVDAGLYVENFAVSSSDLGIDLDVPWRVRKRRLRGGLSDGVDLIEVDNGALRYSVVPTRGMGIWRGDYRGIRLGWNSPVRGPVNPALINEKILGNLGWLSGFDEWIVRCGLSSNGAPGVDSFVDNNGNNQELSVPLHGRIANIPAHYVEIRAALEPPYTIEVLGAVDESIMFFSNLRLETAISTTAGSNRLQIDDVVTNRRGVPSELELLYHCNFGPPLMEENSKFFAPVNQAAPRDAVGELDMPNYADYPAPIPGVVERVHFFELFADDSGQTLTVLTNAARDKACALRFSKAQLPWFTLWKNPAAIEDGYVTGMEPGTNLPNLKRFERDHDRVKQLAPRESHRSTVAVEIADSAADVAALLGEVAKIQSKGKPTVHIGRHHPFADVGEPAGDINLSN